MKFLSRGSADDPTKARGVEQKIGQMRLFSWRGNFAKWYSKGVPLYFWGVSCLRIDL